MTINALILQQALRTHARFKDRALGGPRALDGFHYQLAVSLGRFFQSVLSGDDSVEFAFEGLSDLSDDAETELSAQGSVRSASGG